MQTALVDTQTVLVSTSVTALDWGGGGTKIGLAFTYIVSSSVAFSIYHYPCIDTMLLYSHSIYYTYMRGFHHLVYKGSPCSANPLTSPELVQT